jgi:hypothetical protein
MTIPTPRNPWSSHPGLERVQDACEGGVEELAAKLAELAAILKLFIGCHG